MSSHNSPISPDYHPPDRVGEREGEEEGKNSLWMIRGFRESLINSGGSYFAIEQRERTEFVRICARDAAARGTVRVLRVESK